MFWILSALFACHIPVEAKEFNFDDTGTPENEYALEYVDLWPAKVVLDSRKNQFKLVWFETDPPRHTDIQFSDIAKLKHIPIYEGHVQELQIHLKDGRTFLLDKGPNTRKTAQTFAVLAQVSIDESSPKSIRLIPNPLPDRAAPILVIGSLEGADVLTPPSTKKITTVAEADPTVDTSFDNSTLSSALDKGSIDQTIKSNMARFRSCYVKESRKSPNLAGNINVKFTLNKAGEVTSTSIASSSIQSPLVEKCVLQQIQGLRFDPQPKQSNEVIYPFVFSKQ